jgi:thiamine kinase-like enzyme
VHQEVTIPELTEVVARVAALLGPREGAVSLLEGGITNRNFRVRFGGTDYVVRLPGKDTDLLGIDRVAECAANKQAAELGLAPAVAAYLEDPPCLITRFVEAAPARAAELRRPETLGAVAGALRRIHGSGIELRTGFEAVGTAERYVEVIGQRGGQVPAEVAPAIETARAIRDAASGLGDHAPVPIHADLLSFNFLRSGDDLLIVDWEYAGMGDRWFDLGNFAANNELGDDQEELFLREYLGEAPSEAARAWLKLFRWLSNLREGVWGLVQATVSEVDFDFPAYSRRHLERVAADGPSVEDWLEVTRAAGR